MSISVLQNLWTRLYGLMCLVVLCIVSPLRAQKMGDTVIVVAPSDARLKIGTKVVGVVPRGVALAIEEANKGGFRVVWKGTSGWITKEDVSLPEAALRVFDKAIKKNPLACGYYGRGNARLRTGNRSGAIADFREAIKLGLKGGDVYYARGLAYQTDDRDKASADFTEAIRLEPRWSWPYISRGFVYAEERDYNKAIADYDKAIALDARQATAYLNRGCSWHKKGDFDKAIADYTEAIHLDDADYSSYFGRAIAYREKGDYNRSIDDWTEVIRKGGKVADAYFNRAIVRFTQGDYKRAIADYSEAIRVDPEDGDKYASRAWAYYRNGDSDLAIADCTKTITLGPDTSVMYEVRGSLLVARGDYDRGIADIQKAIQLNPKDQAANFEVWPKTALSAHALYHGERQLRQMLEDRKAMGEHDKIAEPLYRWAIRKFAGEDLGEEVFWNADDSSPHFDGCNQTPTDERPAYICVREEHANGPEIGKRSFEALWSTTVFELYNVANAKDVDRVYLQACCGEVSRERYATNLIRIESRAAEKTRSFYIHIFLPWAKQHRIATDPLLWYLAARSDPAEVLLLQNVDKKDRYWLNYEDNYDNITAWAKANQQEVWLSPKLLQHNIGRKCRAIAGGRWKVS